MVILWASSMCIPSSNEAKDGFVICIHSDKVVVMGVGTAVCIQGDEFWTEAAALCPTCVFISSMEALFPILTVCLGERSGSSYRWVVVHPGLPALQLFLRLMMLKAER